MRLFHLPHRNVPVLRHTEMSEETLFDNPLFREKMQKLGIGFVWITPGIDQQWDVSKGTQQIFEKMMVDLAEVRR